MSSITEEETAGLLGVGISIRWSSLQGLYSPHSVSFPYKTEIPNILVHLFWKISGKKANICEDINFEVF
jgi:hypothetical protein